MKNLLLIVIIILQGINTYCQKSIKYDFRIQYDMQLNFFSCCSYKADLYFNNTQSLFEYQETPFEEKETIADENDKMLDESNHVSFNIRLKDTVRYYIKYDKEDNMIREFVRGFINKEFYQLAESAPIVNWTITEDRKKINQYECTKATCSYRGRNYIVWFTTAIQTNFGPLKLHGLPGLILELSDEDKEVMLSARVVKQEENLVKNGPIDTKIISRSEYKKIRTEGIKKFEEMANRISSKSGRGLNTTVKINGSKSIEID